MTPFWQSGNGETTLTLYQGHVLDVLREMPAESVHCVVTSPPYWGLRDYKLEPQVWGGEQCQHSWGDAIFRERRPYSVDFINPNGSSMGARKREGGTVSQGEFCIQCGSWRGSLGLEPTPDLYVQHLVEVFREVKRVLRRDGTLWLNMGDAYNGYMANQRATSISANNQHARPVFESGHGPRTYALKPKDLLGMPWRVAFALQADGWWLRSDIIWSKPNPMPESVTDRPTKAHEFIFLLAKSERYYYDVDAIREPSEWAPVPDGQIKIPGGWDIEPRSHGIIHADGRTAARYKTVDDPNARGRRQAPEPGEPNAFHPGGRNKRTVWEIATQPYPDAHFATFPEKLVEPCILAGCREGGTVLDPFVGSGTTLLVAQRLGRHGVGIELNFDYCTMAVHRLEAEHVQQRLELRAPGLQEVGHVAPR